MALQLQGAARPAATAPPVESKPAVAGAASATGGWYQRLTTRTPSVKERMFFTEQLALLTATGMSLYQALGLVERQSSNTELARIVRGVADAVSGGRPLSQALSDYPALFNSTYVNLVAAGEQGGFLPDILQELLSADERREEMRAALVAAFSYPVFLLAFSALVIVFVLTWVFPKFGGMFVSIADELPPTTIALMWLSDLIRAQWHWLLVGAGLLVVAVRASLRNPDSQLVLDRVRLRLPGVGMIYRELYTAQLLRVLSLSLQRGVPIVDALRACADIASNRVFRRFLDDVERTVSQGGRIADGFESSPIVPELARQMVRTAEEAGSLGATGQRMADYYENELRKRLQRFSKIVEPVMLVVMGIVVSVIVSSLILPIFKLSQAVG